MTRSLLRHGRGSISSGCGGSTTFGRATGHMRIGNVTTLDQQISEVKRELGKRRVVYERLIAKGKLDKGTADHQTQAMTAVLETLLRVQKEMPPWSS